MGINHNGRSPLDGRTFSFAANGQSRSADVPGLPASAALRALLSSSEPAVPGEPAQVVRRAALVLVTCLLLLCGAVATGLRMNGTHSEPVGFYWAIGKRPGRGDLVFVKPPPLPIFALAKERGYFNVGFSPTPHLIKRLVGVAGDSVTINARGVEVNGIRLANSSPLLHDGTGRPLQFYPLQNYILRPDEVLLMSDYSALSFDARYFGALQATTIECVIKPILTWN